MSDLAPSLSRPFAIAGAAARRRFRARVLRDWHEAATVWQREAERGAAGTVFQDVRWLDAFYAAAAQDASLEPAVAIIEDAESGAFVLALPLVVRRSAGMRIAEFADLGMTDFNAPLLGRAAADRKEARAIFTCLRRAMRAQLGADLLHLTKMPLTAGGRDNPFVRLQGVAEAAVNGNLVSVGEDFDAWRHSLPRTVRKELERSWRVFQRRPQTTFEIVTDPQAALRLLDVMEVQQQQRLAELGQPYKLGNPIVAAHYRDVLERGTASGYAVLGVLKGEGELVAALLALRHGDTAVFIRLTHAGREWSNCSPGRLVISRLMAHLHGDGVRRFDFSVGNFAYKRRFGPVRQPLMEVAAMLTPRGLPALARIRAGQWVRRYPRLRAFGRRLLGKPALREED